MLASLGGGNAEVSPWLSAVSLHPDF